MFMAAAHAASLTADSPGDLRRRRARGRPRGQPPRPRRSASRAALEGEWEARVDALHERYGDYHWVHAINNTALVAAALWAFDDFSAAICGTVQGGWDTDTNGAAVGSIFGALRPVEERWSTPLGGRFASSLPGFDGIGLDELVRRTVGRMLTVEAPRDPFVPRPIDLSTPVPLEGPLDGLDTAKILAAPDDPADWPAWRERLHDAGGARPARGSATTAAPTSASPGRRAASPSPSSGSGTSSSTTTPKAASRPSASAPSRSASSAASTASSSGTPTR